jgi:peptidoglycan/xylan/chitin deacetylase (PgdA/CDA1 family)
LLLLYHRVGTRADDPFDLTVTPPTFAAHLRLLRSHYHVESLETLIEQLPRAGFPDRTVVVTFDDGYVDNIHTAYPLAAAVGVPLTIFVTVQPLIENRPFWWDELALAVYRANPTPGNLRLTLGAGEELPVDTEAARSATYLTLHGRIKRLTSRDRDLVLSQLRASSNSEARPSDTTRPMTMTELQEAAALPGLEIGAHTMSHPVLGSLAAAEQAAELGESRRLLMEIVSRPVRFTAYPFGKASDLSELTTSLAEQAGYRAALTSQPGAITPQSPMYALPRLSVHEWSDGEFLRKLGTFLGEP